MTESTVFGAARSDITFGTLGRRETSLDLPSDKAAYYGDGGKARVLLVVKLVRVHGSPTVHIIMIACSLTNAY